MPEKSKDLATKAPTASSEAAEQAAIYDSIFAATPLVLNDGSAIDIPPHPRFGLCGDEEQDAYEALLFESESWDREPDIFIPGQKVKDSDGNDIELPSDTRPGPLKYPHRKTDPETGVTQRISPPMIVREVQAALGDKYDLLIAGGKSSADVRRIWGRQGAVFADRQAADTKSDGGTVDLEAVPEADSA